MACVEITVAVIPLWIEEVIHDSAAVLADYVQCMGPSVCDLRTQSSPRPEFQDSLKGIVVRCANAGKLKNVAHVGERTAAVDVRHQVQLASLAADVPNLPNH